MQLRSELRVGMRTRDVSDVPVTSIPQRAEIALASGLTGGIALLVPFVLYGWLSDEHSALELPMAAIAWLFGLEHFEQNGYAWWPIVLGLILLGALFAAFGAFFGAVADRFLGLITIPETLGAGFAWGFVTWTFFWYMLLPIARDGAPFRATADSSLFVAPSWVWILGFTILGLATSLAYAASRRV